MNRIHQQNPIEACYRTRLSLHTALDISFLDKLCFLLFFLGYVMTEVCSSPSKANDNYKSKMVIIPLLLSLFILQQKETIILNFRLAYIASEVFIVDTVL